MGILRAGRIGSLLVRVPVDSVVEKVRANPAIVEQSVALSGCAVPHDGLARVFRVDEEGEQLAFRLLYAGPEVRVGRHLSVTRLELAALQRVGALMDRVLLGIRMAGIDPQRASVRGQLLNVEQREARAPRKHFSNSREGEVRKVLVIDRVELIEVHELHAGAGTRRSRSRPEPEAPLRRRRSRSSRAHGRARCFRV